MATNRKTTPLVNQSVPVNALLPDLLLDALLLIEYLVGDREDNADLAVRVIDQLAENPDVLPAEAWQVLMRQTVKREVLAQEAPRLTPFLQRIARRRMPEADVSDLAQDVMIRFLQADIELRPGNRAILRPLLSTIIRNLIRDRHRTYYVGGLDGERRQDVPFDMAPEQPDPDVLVDEQVLAREIDPRLLAALESLSLSDRQLVWLRFVLGVHREELAVRWNVQTETLRRREHRARTRLRSLLDAQAG